MRDVVRFIFREKVVELNGDAPKRMLLDWLRLTAGATGTKEGCAEGDCGACTVVLERVRRGKIERSTVNSCILLAGQADGARIVTVEDLAAQGSLHPVQDAMVRHHGAQCGFCTPGIVMSLYQLQVDGERPVTREAVCDQLAGNLCRCTGYRPIIDAALDACARPAELRGLLTSAFDAITDAEDIFVGDTSRFFAAPRLEAGVARLYFTHPDAVLVAGGTDFGLSVTKGLADASKIIWLGHVAGLNRVIEDDDGLQIGAMVSHSALMPHLAALAPDLGEMMRRFGSVQVRNSGTIGGNIANGSPIGDLAPCLIALGATVELRCGDELRTLALEEFFLGYKKQDRRLGEYVRRINIPRPSAKTAIKVFKISKRRDEDISSVLAAFAIKLDGRR
ncbi:MAG: FAD binding domain-containing protein, partial [Hyphomicrobiaceae bacterium]